MLILSFGFSERVWLWSGEFYGGFCVVFGVGWFFCLSISLMWLGDWCVILC